VEKIKKAAQAFQGLRGFSMCPGSKNPEQHQQQDNRKWNAEKPGNDGHSDLQTGVERDG
jgi:hypothetical protein